MWCPPACRSAVGRCGATSWVHSRSHCLTNFGGSGTSTGAAVVRGGGSGGGGGRRHCLRVPSDELFSARFGNSFDYLEVEVDGYTFVLSCEGDQTGMSSASQHW